MLGALYRVSVPCFNASAVDQPAGIFDKNKARQEKSRKRLRDYLCEMHRLRDVRVFPLET